MRRLAGLALALAGAAPAGAEPPPPDYFTGVYERVGRSGGAAPQLLNDLWRLDPAPEGGLRLSPCTGPAQSPSLAQSPNLPQTLSFTRFGDLDNLLQSDAGLWCQFFNDGGNYALLSCGAEDGSAFQLRVATDDRATACPAGAQ